MVMMSDEDDDLDGDDEENSEDDLVLNEAMGSDLDENVTYVPSLLTDRCIPIPKWLHVHCSKLSSLGLILRILDIIWKNKINQNEV